MGCEYIELYYAFSNGNASSMGGGAAGKITVCILCRRCSGCSD